MKFFIKTALFFLISTHYCYAQDSVVLITPEMFTVNQVIPISKMDGWFFRAGDYPLGIENSLDTAGWKKLKLSELSPNYADGSNKVEGWFKFRFILDSAFAAKPFSFMNVSWAATDIYLNGKLVASFGSTGGDNKEFEEFKPFFSHLLSFPIYLEVGKEYLLTVHYVDQISFFSPGRLKSSTFRSTPQIWLTGPDYYSHFQNYMREALQYHTIWFATTLVLTLLFWLLVFQNSQERKYLLPIALFSSFSTLSNLARLIMPSPDITYTTYSFTIFSFNLSLWLVLIFTFIIIVRVLNFELSRTIKVILIVFSSLGVLSITFPFFLQLLFISAVVSLFIYIYILFSSWKKIHGAQWAIVVGLSLSTLFGGILGIVLLLYGNKPYLILYSCFYLFFPISLLVYVSMRFKEIINEVQLNALQIVKMTEEKKEYAVKQQEYLQDEVARQTTELRTTLDNLKSTQAQLIQSEKMASLGELTAGIAHEIQNPLNFINNFSEVNAELIDELKSELATGKMQQAIEIADDIKENEQKIIHHGKRADAIVKGMLQHSRSNSGQKEPTDINALTDEYLKLAYHGLRAKDNNFNAILKTDYDEGIGNINIIPQDIGRVILNLITNAFYAVNERSQKNKTAGDNTYEPTVIVKTKKSGDVIQIIIKDNGSGIPQKVLDKIFQPFFTTKPTGEGTGLGLSLSYDIITLAHGGELSVQTKEGEGAEFKIVLPITT